MNPQELKQQLEALLPSPTFEEGGEWTTAFVDPATWAETARLLRTTTDLDLDYLFCVTAVDWKTHFTMVYHLSSTTHRHTLVVKIKLDREHPEVATVSDIWRTAEFHEREAYDLMGIVFIGHPDLRRLFMTDDWKGWPLRKDYEDPINMIKL
ncbi:MAG TPA: NADH-quinone oxidoreductase subunit C [Puia sp.]|uniref:NADH-quinone oxidoreductase subunit C n=1 Tax=Puia sp. TaxID=2045100 RepID=UPI002B87FCD0|nr:NADH-quinone oxidoreductase subunit C [Puia sp.]HVU93848.1 NADH-quinone oxidoreductase subunit C [Puia sp.]